MIKLSVSDAISLVRKNIDELQLNPSSMFGQDTDNLSLNTIIGDTLPEAIDAVVLAAPVALLQGKDLVKTISHKNKVVSIQTNDRVLRIVRVKASDSDIVITSAVPEDSALGRMQHNEYVCGTYDNPVLVRLQGSGGDTSASTTPTQFKYYSSKDDALHGEPFSLEFKYLPFAEDLKTTEEESIEYEIPELLKDSIIYHLTGMVLTILGETDKAKHFFDTSVA